MVHPNRVLSPHGRRLDESTAVMGILNATPDSFYSPSRVWGPQALEKAREMIADGAHMLDIGGESTRPGSSYVTLEEELSRVIPLIRGIRSFSQIPLSVDTRKSQVARAALEAGADWINDISALRDDPGMVELAVEAGMPVVLMHMKGTPETMQEAPRYRHVVEEVRSFLWERAEWAMSKGVPEANILLDPGIGFGKTLKDNLELLANLDKIGGNFPVLVGLSRKSFIGALSPGSPDQRLGGSLAGALWAFSKGASVFRVHDVGETVQALKVWKALEEAGHGLD